MPTPPPKSRPGRSLGAGIGLVLTMVVMLIVLAMYFGSFGGKSYMQNVVATKKEAEQTVADINTKSLLDCISIYRLANNRLPQTPEELDAGPALFDPWKRQMTFSYRIEKGAAQEVTTVIWRSAGPDGQMNTPDDVVKEDRVPL